MEPTIWLLSFSTVLSPEFSVSVVVPPLDASVPTIIDSHFYKNNSIAVLSFTAFSEGFYLFPLLFFIIFI